MPLVKIEIVRGHAREYKRQLLDTIHEALKNVLDIPDNDRYQRLYELEDADFERDRASDKFTLIELTLFPGRSKELKRQIIREVTDSLNTALEIPINEVFIVINEPIKENWGMGGEQLSELGFEYRTE